jgi:2-(1,2-epoxy-1,2-dihydrophenyl)acetyl-CoA isomerase
VTRLVFNRPQVKNALDARCWELLAQGLDEFAADPAARVLVLSGAGGDFSAGADLGGGITGSADAVAAKMREIAGIVLRLHEMPKPTVAAVDGVAIGVSMSLALGCDLVIASDRARFGAVFAKVGLTPDGGLSWLLPRLVGPHRAKELTLLARLVDAAEAERIGLVNRVVPADDLAAATEQWCALLADRTPECARGTLALLDDAWSTTLAEALENEAATQQVAVTALRGQDSQ